MATHSRGDNEDPIINKAKVLVTATALARAFQLLEAGQTAAALALAPQPPTAQPDWLLLCALCHSHNQQPTLALPLYQQLSELVPMEPAHFSNLGNCLLELDQISTARTALERALELGADDSATLLALARALHLSAQPRAAAELLQRALRLSPDDAEMLLLAAKLDLALDDLPRALARLDRIAQCPLEASQRTELAQLNLSAGRYALARTQFMAALGDPLARFDALIGLALSAERSNQLAVANAHRAEIENMPAPLSARQQRQCDLLDARLGLRDKNAAPRVIALLQQLLAAPLDDPALTPSLWFYLGRAFDQSGDTANAAAAFAQGHAARLALVTQSHPNLIGDGDLLALLDRPMPALQLRALPPDGLQDPVFLVGFPRSGTTLLEQLLDAHAGLSSFDEQPFLQRLIDQIEASGQRYPADLASLSTEAIVALRARYRQLAQGVMPVAVGTRWVDKNPLNLARLPLLRALFPNAQVLLAVRHPCDVVLSCWMQDFRAPGLALMFKTLDDTAQMYARVFSHWAQHADALALPTHVLRYEDLVQNVAATAQPMFEFLGLPWTDELLEFTTRAGQRGAISTPSYAAVTEPVNRRAVGRWQRYHDHFSAATLQTLTPWVTRFGYTFD